jgi:sulfur carrier protein ThiS
VQATGTGFDGAVAAWEAFAKVEELLRENRALRDTVAVVVDTNVARRAFCD